MITVYRVCRLVYTISEPAGYTVRVYRIHIVYTLSQWLGYVLQCIGYTVATLSQLGYTKENRFTKSVYSHILKERDRKETVDFDFSLPLIGYTECGVMAIATATGCDGLAVKS